MLKQLVTYIGVVFVLMACVDLSEPKKPGNLIPKDKMVDILIDARLVGSVNGNKKKLLESKGFVLKDYVFEKHGIDSLQFALSNNYYAYHLKVYKEIYNKAVDSLEQLKSVLNEKKKKEEEAKKREEDSISKVEKKKDTIGKKEKLKKTDKPKEDEGVLVSPPVLDRVPLPEK